MLDDSLTNHYVSIVKQAVMERYDFDEVINRRGSYDEKYGGMMRNWGRDDLIPLWVADMDFATPDFILDALHKQIDRRIMGYSLTPETFFTAIIDWIRSHHGWNVEREWIKYVPGLVKALGMVVNYYTKPGDKIVIQPPVYHPFRLVPQGNGRQVVYNPLKMRPDGGYDMDLDGLERLLTDDCRMLVLCNPHNPAGICWDKDTLVKLAEICHEHGVMVVSDEIHCDLALFGNKHIPFATVSDKAAEISVTFGAPSKTFNIAGIVSSYLIIPNEKLRAGFYNWIENNEIDYPTVFAVIATIEAYTKGEPWRKQMLAYVEDNIKYVEQFCEQKIACIRPLRPEASYLVWLDCRQMGLSHDELNDLFVNKARLGLNDGEMFGIGGEGFMRLNVATPRTILSRAMNQLAEAVRRLGKS